MDKQSSKATQRKGARTRMVKECWGTGGERREGGRCSFGEATGCPLYRRRLPLAQHILISVQAALSSWQPYQVPVLGPTGAVLWMATTLLDQ